MNYRCGTCGARGVKLWRPYQSSHVELFCRTCAEKDQGKALEDISPAIGWLVPAIPDLLPDAEGVMPEEGAFWGYTSVPAWGVGWWYGLPPVLPLHQARSYQMSAEWERLRQ